MVKANGKKKHTSMDAVEWEGKPNQISVKSLDIPTVKHPLDAIIRLTTAGICGTDLHIFHGRLGSKPPFTLGHEMIGIVEQVGEGVTTLKTGDRVLVFDLISCGFCENCLKGLRSLCLTVNPPFEGDFFGIQIEGIDLNGGQAQFVRVPFAAESTILLPAGTEHELDYLTLSDIFPTAWTCLDYAKFQPGDTVAVFGAGPVGLLCAYSAILQGASKVYSIDRIEARLDKAKSIGAVPIDFSKGDPVAQIMKFEPIGVDRACDCVGFECVDAHGKNVVNEVLTNAINVTKPGGGVGVIGVYVPDDRGAPTTKTKKGILELPWGTAWEKILSFGSGAVTPHLHAYMLKHLIDSGRATPSFVFSKEITIDEAPLTYKEFSNHEILKAFIRFEN